MIQSLIPTLLLTGRLEVLVDALDGLIETADDQVLTNVNKTLARPENLSLLIKGICSDASMLDKTLSGSYYHGNGFHKIVLLSGRAFKLRLHHFGSSAKIPMENIHDHRWCFASTILYGDLKMDLFCPSDQGPNSEKTYHFIYQSDKSGGNYKTDFVNVAHLRKSESRLYRPGDSYLMKTHELHRIQNMSGQESVTLILTGKPVSSKCNLYSRRMILEEEKNTVPYRMERMIDMLQALCEKVFPQKN